MSTARIKLTVSRVGNGFSQSAGHEVDVSIDEAFSMVDSGQAFFVGPAPDRPVLQAAIELNVDQSEKAPEVPESTPDVPPAAEAAADSGAAEAVEAAAADVAAPPRKKFG